MVQKGERLNFLTHFVGSIAAIIGLIALVIATGQQGDVLSLFSATVYGVTLVLLYVCSTLNHSLQGSAKKVFQKLDFLAIYLLIAGTYTPFALISLREGLGWGIFGLVWGLAILGIVQELLPNHGKRMRSLILYLAMGWAILIAIKPLIKTIGLAGFSWLLLGGLFYTIGIIFYILDEQVEHFHGIWHLCVLAGSTFQYFSIYFYVVNS